MANLELVTLILFAAAAAVALVVRHLAVPYTVGLVVVGLALGATRVVSAPHLTKELLFAVFLPGLLFEAAFHLDFRRFWQNRIAIFALAIPGVIAAIAVTAALLTPFIDALHFISGFRFIDGLVFAALLAATDPIAVVGLFKTLCVPRRLSVLVEGESLLNDGTSIVFFTLILAFANGHQASVGGAALAFVRVVGVGLLTGAAAGFAASQVIHRVDEAMVEITLTTLAAYGSFIGAEHLGGSGVIATVAAGMICGNLAANTGMTPNTRMAVEVFWEYVAFAFNSLVFLLIGFEVTISSLISAWRPILVAFLVVTAGRAVVVSAITVLLRRTRERLPWPWVLVLSWGGLRGALSMVLALSLGGDFPHRQILVTMTFGVVLLSILVQGLSMAPLLRWLRLVPDPKARQTYDQRLGELLAARAALTTLDTVASDRAVPADIVASLKRDYQDRSQSAEADLRRLNQERVEFRAHVLVDLRRTLLLAERDAVVRGAQRDLITAAAASKLTGDIDARLLGLERDSSSET